MTPSRSAAAYVLAAALWVSATSALVASGPDAPVVEVLKGIAFVVVTGVALYLILRGNAQRLAAEGVRLRQITDNLADVVYRVRIHPDRAYEYVSPSSTALTGYTPEEHYADPNLVWQVVHPDDHARLTDLPGDEPVRMRWIHRDGHTVWVEVRNRAVTDTSGRVVALMGVARDITRHVELEDRISFQASVLEQLDDAIIGTDPDRKVQFWNAAAERMLGIPAAEALGKPPEDVFAFELRTPGGTASVRARTSVPGGRSRQDGELTTRAGHRLLADVSVSALTDAAGRLYRYTVFRDVTEQRREAELLRATFDAAPLAVMVGDRIGDIDYWSPSAQALLGWTAAEVSVARLLPPESSNVADGLAARLSRGETVAGELELLDAAGTRVPVRAIVAPIDGGRGYVAFLEDLREHRRLEAQLRQAQKMEAIGRLAGSVAHDFNNILTVIQGYARLVADEVPASAAEDVAQVLHAAERASEMTKHLLVFSRTGGDEARPVDVDMVLREAIPLVTRLVPERISVESEFRAGVWVTSNPVEVEQILLNLVVNAVDATPGPGRITIETRMERFTPDFVHRHLGTREGDHLVLSVTDTGSGMDEATQARIFEPFFTTKGPAEGTGLGLATVYAIVQRAGGTIWCYSELARGTTFKVYLPAAAATAAQLPSDRAAVIGGTERVLIAEDDPLVRRLAVRSLQHRGYEVTAAATPTEAIELARGGLAPAILVADVVMPQMDGPALAEALGMPVVFMSGYEASALPGLRLGKGRGFVAKPFAPDALAHEVRRILDETYAGSDAAAST